MLVGGCVQALLMLSAGRRYIVLGLPFVFLLLRIVNGLLIHYGYLKNPYMQGVYLGRRTALVPNEQGVIEEDGSKKEKVVVFLLGAKSNHPLGFYSPKFLQMALWLTKMNGQFCSTDQPNGCTSLLLKSTSPLSLPCTLLPSTLVPLPFSLSDNVPRI